MTPSILCSPPLGDAAHPAKRLRFIAHGATHIVAAPSQKPSNNSTTEKPQAAPADPHAGFPGAGMTPEAIGQIVTEQSEVIKTLVRSALKKGFVPYHEKDDAIQWATKEAYSLVRKCRTGEYTRHLRFVLRRRLWGWPPPLSAEDKPKSIEERRPESRAQSESGGSGRTTMGTGVHPLSISGWGRDASRKLLQVIHSQQENSNDDPPEGDTEPWDIPRHEGKWYDTSARIAAQALDFDSVEAQACIDAEAEDVLVRRVDDPGRLRGGTHQVARLKLEGCTEEEIADRTGRDIGWVRKAVSEISRKLDTSDVALATRPRTRVRRPRTRSASSCACPQPIGTKAIFVDGKLFPILLYPMPNSDEFLLRPVAPQD